MSNVSLLALTVLFVGSLLVLTLVHPRLCIRICAVLSLVLMVWVPITRLDGPATVLRTIVPLVVISLTLLMVLGSRPRRVPRFIGFTALFLTFGAIAIIGGESKSLLLYAVVAFAVSSAVFQATVLSAQGDTEWYMRCIIALGVFIALYSVGEMMFEWEPLWRGGWIAADQSSRRGVSSIVAGTLRAQAGFGHPIPLGLFLSVASVLAALVSFRTWWSRIFIVLILLSGLVASGSRNSLAAVVVVLAGVFVARSRLGRWPAMLLMVVVAALAIEQIAESEITSTGSFTHRIGALEAIPGLIAARGVESALVGDGWGSLASLYEMGLLQGDGLEAIDNSFVFLLATTGVIGLVIFCAIMLVAFRRGRAVERAVLAILLLNGLFFDWVAWPSTVFLGWGFMQFALENRDSQLVLPESIHSIDLTLGSRERP